MSRPAKSYLQLIRENKSHRTKEELEIRKKGEESLLSKVKIKEFKETKSNKIAHAEFKGIIRLLEKVEKNDDLFAGAINRYCCLRAECIEIDERRETLYKNIQDLQNEYEKDENFMDKAEYFSLQAKLTAQYLAADKQLSPKRKMMFDIEKENLLTIASALRCVPKSPDKEEDDDDDLYN